MNIQYDALDLLSGERVQGRLGGASPVLNVADASQIVLHMSVGDVFAYRREGDNLVLILRNADRLLLDDFFAAEQPALILIRQSDTDGVIGVVRGASEDFVEVRFLDAAPGFLTPRYADVSISLAEFETVPLASLGLSSAGAGAAVAAAALVAFGVAGGDTKGDTTPKDTTAPAAARGLSIGTGSDGTMTISGMAERGATATILWPDGTTSTTIADAKGMFTAVSTKPQPEGTVAVTVTDSAGNVSDTATIAYEGDATADTTAPTAPDGLSVSANADGSATVQGTAEPGAVVTITWPDGATTNVTARPDGTFEATLSNPQTKGAITVTATDASGNTSSLATLTYDVSLPDDTPQPPSDLADTTNADGTVTLTGTAEPGATVEVTWPDGATSTATADENGDFAVTTATPQPLGTITAKDRSGSGSAAATHTYDASPSLDTTAPAAPVIVSMTHDTGLSSSDGITTDATPAFSGTAEAGATIKVYDGTVLLGTAEADASGNWSFASPHLADGARNVTVTATDASGNASTASAHLALTVDSAAGIAIDDQTAGDGIVNGSENSALTISGSATHVEDGRTVTVTLTDGAGAIVTSMAAVSGGVWATSGIDLSTLADGWVTVMAMVTDLAGNMAEASAALTLDTMPPDAPAITDMATDTGSSPSDGITADATPIFTGTAEAGATVSIHDGSNLLGTATADASGNWSFTSPTLADGARDITAVATDAAGNLSTASAPFALSVDTMAGITIDGPIAVDDSVNGTEIGALAISGSAANMEDGRTVAVTFTDGTGATVTDAAAVSGGVWTTSGADLSALADGVVTVDASASDVAGNAVNASAAITLDTTPPSLTIEAISNDYGVQGDFATFADTVQALGTSEPGQVLEVAFEGVSVGTATADASGLWISPEIDFSVVADGTIATITATATDAAGNNTTTEQVILKQAPGLNVSGTAGADWLTGTDVGDVLVGNGGADTLLGLGGHDRLHISDTTFSRIDGGAGLDGLVLDGTGLVLDFTAGSFSAGVDVTGIETIDITGSGANALTVSRQDVLDLSDTTDTLIVTGDADDAVNAAGFHDSGLSQTFDGHVFGVYTDGAARLWIEDTVGTVLV